MEKKYYIIPTIKIKEMETESLMAGSDMNVYNENNDETIGNSNEIQSKPMYNDFNVWEK